MYRDMSQDDYDELVDLWSAGREAEMPSETCESFSADLAFNKGLCIVATTGTGEIVGSVMGRYDGRNAFITHLRVTPRLRGLGIGTRLIGDVSDRLKKLSPYQTLVLAMSDDDRTHDMWEHMGYVDVDDVTMLTKQSSAN